VNALLESHPCSDYNLGSADKVFFHETTRTGASP
jgi:hypothetical protein